MFPARFLARSCRGMSRRIALRRGLGTVLIAAYAFVAAGIPLPMINSPAKSGERFPCESSGCGCNSSEHCWRSCCCHTLAERLAWAHENGVKPPDFALVEARKAGLNANGQSRTTKVVTVAMAAESCCTKQRDAETKAVPSCCSAKRTCCESAATRSCCSSHGKAHDKDDSANDRSANDGPANFIIAYRALGCRGQSLNWLAAVPTLISVELNLFDQLPLVTWLGPHSSDIAAGVSDVPTPPPPEHA